MKLLTMQKNKFKKEKYIDQRYSDRTGLWTFRVNVRQANICKSFNEATYNDAKTAYEYAKAYRDKVVYQFNQGSVLKKTTLTIKDVFEESFDLLILREETKRKHRIYFERYIHNEQPIKNLNQGMIIECLNDMVNDCSDDTINRIFSIWKRIVKTALVKEYIGRDYTLGIIVPKSHRLYKEKRPASTSKATLDLIIDEIGSSGLTAYEKESYKLFMLTLYYTGARPGEIFALNKNDVHDDYISITKEIGSSLEEHHVVRTCKTESSIRNIPICKELKPILKRAMYLSECDILFATKENDYYDTNDVSTKIRKYSNKLGLEFHLYQLRHLFSSDLVRDGVDLRTIQELMGHASKGMTLSYARSDDSTKMKALSNR